MVRGGAWQSPADTQEMSPLWLWGDTWPGMLTLSQCVHAHLVFDSFSPLDLIVSVRACLILLMHHGMLHLS